MPRTVRRRQKVKCSALGKAAWRLELWIPSCIYTSGKGLKIFSLPANCMGWVHRAGLHTHLNNYTIVQAYSLEYLVSITLVASLWTKQKDSFKLMGTTSILFLFTDQLTAGLGTVAYTFEQLHQSVCKLTVWSTWYL